MDISAPTAVLSPSRSWALLRENQQGRLAVATETGPDIFPVTFVVDRGSVVFRTAAGAKLDASDAKPVALEADGVDAAEGSAWSVVVKGLAREVRGLHESLDALFLPLSPLHPGAKPHLVRIEVTSITGRWFITA